MLVGLALLIFEFYTAGVGIAGVVGAGATILACYGLAELPTRGWAVGLIVAAMLAFAVDVQVGLPRIWTGVGVMLTIVGSWYLFEPRHRGVAPAVVDHADRRDRRDHVDVHRRHAVDGADPLRDTHDRPRVDDR